MAPYAGTSFYGGGGGPIYGTAPSINIVHKQKRRCTSKKKKTVKKQWQKGDIVKREVGKM